MKKHILVFAIIFVGILGYALLGSISNSGITTALDNYENIEEYTLVSSRVMGGDVDFQSSEIINKKGEIIHQWKTDFDYISTANNDKDHQLTTLLSNGDALILSYEKGLARVDWNSNTIWNLEGNFHHDVVITKDYIYTLGWETRFISYKNSYIPIMDEIMITLDHDGVILQKKSLYDIFSYLIPEEIYDRILMYIKEKNIYEELQNRPLDYHLKSNEPWDIFHMNSLEQIKEDISLFKEGQFLVSMRTINTVAIFDPETEGVIWEYTGDLIRQHHPSLLKNGNILIYDNGGDTEYSISIVENKPIKRDLPKRPYTRVIEINPKTKEVIWEYKSNPPDNFFSKIMGSAQRLDDGDTLITDAFNGVIYEVSSNGHIEWEYKPRIEGSNFYRTYRLSKDEKILVDKLRLRNSLIDKFYYSVH